MARIEALRIELKAMDALSSAKVQTYDGVPGSGWGSDSVSERLERIERVELDILYLERWTLPIRRLHDDLGSPYVLEPARKEMLAILRLRYLYGNTWERVINELKISQTTFARRRRELVDMAGRYLGVR